MQEPSPNWNTPPKYSDIVCILQVAHRDNIQPGLGRERKGRLTSWSASAPGARRIALRGHLRRAQRQVQGVRRHVDVGLRASLRAGCPRGVHGTPVAVVVTVVVAVGLLLARRRRRRAGGARRRGDAPELVLGRDEGQHRADLVGVRLAGVH